VDPGLAGYDEARGREIYREILERVRALPGVRAASVASLIPYGEVTEGESVRRPGTKGDEGRASAISNVVGADYFASLGLKVIRGRGFTPAEEESPDGARVVLVDEPLAMKLFPNEDPIGQQVVFVKADQTPKGLPYQIVGLVPGLRHDLFDRAPVAHVYTPFGQNYHSWMNLHVKLSGGGQAAEASTIATLRETLRAVDPRMPVLSIKSLENYRETNFFLWIARTGAKFFATFGLLALFLAVVGIYGVKAYLVSLRTREIGLRMALGAAPRDVLWLVLKDGLALTVTGVVLGLGLSALIATAVSGMVYQSRTFDPLVYSAAVAVLVGASMVATYVPARRAMKVEPTRALRTE
jgi:predicted permease